MENGTPGVSDNSFTRQLIGELQQRTKKTQTTWQLHGRMMIRRGRGQLKRTPCHFPLSDKDASRIELRPLRKDAAPVLYGAKGNFNSSLGIPDLTDSLSTMSTEDDVLSPEDEDLIVGNRILLAVNLKDWTKVPLPQDWQRWLRQGAPENIESIIAMHRVYSPQRSAGTSFIEPQDPDSWREGLPTVPGHPDPDRPKRLDEALVWTEGAFDSHSSLLLVSIALPLWTYLPANPAYTFVGFVTSGNRMHSAALSRTNSLSKIKKVAAEFDSQHGWYKWYFVLSLCLLPSFWRILPQKNTESLMLFLALMAFAVGTPFSMLVVSSISREYEGELFSQSNTSFKHH
ncbi:hypothetical protein MMC30_006109 [Trapelia coarctata]|nr:hypothetical protein [Trapelia coarctata]